MNQSLNKKNLRKEFLVWRKNLAESFVSEASQMICENISSLEIFRKAEGICAFHPIDGEPRIIPLLDRFLAEGKKIFLPRYSLHLAHYEMASLTNFANGLRIGRFKIAEPISRSNLNDFQLEHLAWLVPGVVFSLNGTRIGFGWGTYDIVLKGASGLKIGVCYEHQISAFITPEPHDMPMDYVVTEKNIYKCTKTNEGET